MFIWLSILTRLQIGWFDSWQVQEILLISSAQTSFEAHPSNGYNRFFPWGWTDQGLEADLLMQFSINESIYPPLIYLPED
jgi:hypothetical protein